MVRPTAKRQKILSEFREVQYFTCGNSSCNKKIRSRTCLITHCNKTGHPLPVATNPRTRLPSRHHEAIPTGQTPVPNALGIRDTGAIPGHDVSGVEGSSNFKSDGASILSVGQGAEGASFDGRCKCLFPSLLRVISDKHQPPQCN